jgi:hypothetical protein
VVGASAAGNDGANDLIVSDIIALNEKQAWLIGEHVAKVKA